MIMNGFLLAIGFFLACIALIVLCLIIRGIVAVWKRLRWGMWGVR
jgi:hypothetical protein